MKKIAVTGGLSAGKTTVCQIFKNLGAYVVSADEIVHQLLSSGTATAKQVINLFGSDIISGREIDRKKVAAKVFSQPDLLTALERIIHPAVFDEMEQRYNQVCKGKKHSLFIAEIPLLYEAEGQSRFDAVISILADPSVCQGRFVGKTQSNSQEFDKRMLRQLPPELKAEKADYTIQNNGTLEQLERTVQELYLELTKD